MIRLIYNNTAFKILNEFQTSQSNNEVTFNDITIDFTGYSLADMPLKYQEVQIKKCNDNQDILTQGDVLFFGYVDTIKLGKMQMSQEDRELTITLLSPLKLATVRTVSLSGTYELIELFPLIFEPLINDGFTLAEINVPNGQILVNYSMQSIESVMNDISLKRNIYWFIDQNKNIYINSIDYLFGKEVKRTIESTSTEEGLLEISPSIEAVDYANVINIKNARLIYEVANAVEQPVYINFQFPFLNLPKTVKNGDIVEFKYPIILSTEIAKQICNEKNWSSVTLMYLSAGDTYCSVSYSLNTNTFTYMADINGQTSNITYSDTEGAEGGFVLQRDSFFNNLITGIKYNGSSNCEISYIETYSALRYAEMKFMYSAEINKLKGIISESGQIEKTVNANEAWFTLAELTDYARSLLIQDKNTINSIVLKYDKDYDFNVGDIIEINLPDFYIEGKFAITKIIHNYENDLEQSWTITLQDSQLLSSYIDIFRAKQEQEDYKEESSLILSEFIEEGINEIHEIESSDENTLNFISNGIL